ncbi:MAG: type I restriction endonuclease subunit R [Candidatus Endonucleobacter bathymodioli]|uniref:Type I restriction enzyme endonuclease subunit n=1 Tax=Candidatus Endonucleibacter bathymodioli TaxID=539814 RepID=A0AA90NQZ8_9GAMM|nr:type I restriction endonuclease subunit R [Candidatus Endonucleobacter bathymodioli]
MSELSESELPAIALLKQLGYDYFDAKKEMFEVVLHERLTASLMRINPWLNGNALQKVMRKIEAVNGSSLMEINADIHQLITKADAYSLKPTPDAHPIPVKFIDFENIDNNDFLVVNQMKFKGARQNSIPDLVIFVNGLPLVVIEAKNQTVDISDLSDLSYYETNSPKLFHYNQIMSGINRVNALYGTIGSPMQFYSKFNEAPTQTLIDLIDREVTPQDVMIFNLFQKEVFLDIIKYFVIFEVVEGKTIKKLPRYQQLRAVNKIVHRLKTKNQGGVVWHTQGSGKSITMIYLASKLRASTTGFDNPTILVVTDRKDLDAQIASTFRRTGFPNPIQTNSIAHLKSLLRDDYGKTLTTTIQKFQEKAEEKKQVEILSDKENIFVLIDEAHRSQYGLTASYMRKSLPNAKFIAFTGTPIDKENKSTLKEFYGGDYIDKYTIKQSVADGNTLPILYESGLPELFIEQEQMDEVFGSVFEGVSDVKLGYLKNQATSLDVILLAERRVNEVVKHIIKHYSNKSYQDGFKAMIVCHNRKQVIAYKKAFDILKEQGLNPYESKAVMSFDTKKDPQEYYELATPEVDVKQTIENFKLPFGNKMDKTPGGRRQFDNTAFLIVSDMLLTGYDAPILQTLYLDKVLREHNLLQAIARVNRTRKGKSAGYVVDYVGITKHLVEALEIFSGDLEPADVMTDIEGEKTTLENNHTRLVNYFKKCKYDRKEQRYDFILKSVEFLKPQDIKDGFKKILADFNRSMNIVLPAPFASKYDYDFKLFNELKLMVRDAKEKITREDSRKLQSIIDEHLRASGIEYLLGEPIDISDYQKFKIELTKKGQHSPLDKAKAIIKANKDDNPHLALELSELLKKILLERKGDRKQAIQDLFTQMEEIIERHKHKHLTVGLEDEKQLLVYNIVEKQTETAKEFTLAVYEDLAPYLIEKAILMQSGAQKDMRNAIKPLLKKHNLDRNLSKEIVQKLVDEA